MLVWRDGSRVIAHCNNDGVRDHHGEHSNQRKEHADSIPSHAQLSAANRRTASSALYGLAAASQPRPHPALSELANPRSAACGAHKRVQAVR